MKRHFFTLILLFTSTLIYSQTLYVPGGASNIQDSGNGNVGVGTNNLNGKLSVDINTWGSNLNLLDLRNSAGATTADGSFAIKLGRVYQNRYFDILFNTTNYGALGPTTQFLINRGDNGQNLFAVDGAGNIGIGTNNPQKKLHIKSTYPYMRFELDNDQYSMIEWYETSTRMSGIQWVGHQSPKRLSFMTNGGSGIEERLIISDIGNIGIGTTTPTNKLEVAGTIRAEEIKVETGWADFVFHPTYNLRPLQEVNTYIQQNGHLPEMPTAKEVEENGISLGEMNAKLLQKIEELTLYTIEQQKTIEKQNIRISNLEEKLNDK